MRTFILLIALCASLIGSPAHAQDFPSRPITLLCGFPPGSGADGVLRALARAARKHLGQEVIVENRPGAAGTIAATSLLAAKADGYTLVQVTNSLMRQPSITKTAYDPVKDFSYILGVTAFEMGLVVRADSPWKTLDELVAYARSNPGKITYGTSGTGTTQHQIMEQIGELKGVKWTHVPYKGSAPIISDLQGGHILAASDITGWAQFVDSGKFRLLAVYSDSRLKRWPNVPTLKEHGLNIAESVPWGIVGPTGMEPAIASQLQETFRKALEDPEVVASLAFFGQEVRYLPGAEYRKYMHGRIPIEAAAVEKYNLRQQ